jgi:hypothetical protein
MDPRVKTGLPGLTQQFTLSLEAYRGMEETYALAMEAKKLRSKISEAINRVGRGPLAQSLAALDKSIVAIAGEARGDGGGGAIDVRDANFTRLNGGFASLMEMLQGADLPPTMPMINAAVETQKALAKLKANWTQLKAKDLTSINANLRLANQPELVP